MLRAYSTARFDLPPSGLKRSFTVLVTALLGAGYAHGLGVGRPLTVSSIGEPLNLLFPLNLAAGESLSLDCVQAKVLAGESRIPTQNLRLQLDSRTGVEAHSVRLQSTMPISEPVVSVELTVGCNGVRFTRQFTALIDPPPDPRNPAPDVVVATPVAPVMSESPVAPPVAEAPASALPASSSTHMAASVAKTAAPSVRRQVPRKPAAQVPAPAPAPVAAPAAAVVAPVAVAAPAVVPAPAPKRPAAEKAALPAVAPSAPEVRTVARLQLDPLDDLSSSAVATSPEALAEEKRLAALESEMAAMRKSTDDFHAGIQALRGKLEAERSERYQNPLIYGLMLLALALLAGGAWMWRRLVFVQAQQAAWWAGSIDEPVLAPGTLPAGGVPPAPEVKTVQPIEPRFGSVVAGATTDVQADGKPPGGREPKAQVADLPSSGANWDEAADTPAHESPSAQAMAEFLGSESPAASVDESGWNLPAQMRAAEDDSFSLTPRSGFVDFDVLSPAQQRHSAAQLMKTPELAHIRVEELIDLDQQVDFFLVLGQDDAAIDLLTEHIGRGDAGNALAYLKLLEIMQHHNDEAGFQRIARQFADRFHALAPAWNENLSEGEGLIGDAATLQRVQSCWADSGAAMALLQDLLARGGDEGVRFDLAAYRDILMLYAVARDLSEHEVRDEQIDVFLPLDLDPANTPSASMMATMAWEESNPPVDTYPVDLDLSLDEPIAPRKP